MGRTKAFSNSLKRRSLKPAKTNKKVRTIKQKKSMTQHDLAKAASKSPVKVQSRKLDIVL